MEYKYSICYPDTEEISFFEDGISKQQVLPTLVNFNWDNELSKELEYYAPSLEFINLETKKIIIFSGIGENKLERFQVMFIEPSTTDFTDVFNEDNYKNSVSYSKILEINEAHSMLKNYLGKNYNLVRINLDKESSLIIHHKKESEGAINIYMQYFIRICAPLVSVFFLWFGMQFYIFSNKINIISILFFGFGILLLVGTFKIWSKPIK